MVPTEPKKGCASVQRRIRWVFHRTSWIGPNPICNNTFKMPVCQGTQSQEFKDDGAYDPQLAILINALV